MPDREQFGPRLRRERERRRITIEEVAEATRVSADLFEAMENNEFSRWPAGIFARAFVRDYARFLGLDADAVVNEFCRHFPNGDRRARRLLHAQAELLGHSFTAAGADPLPAGHDRRAPRTPAAPPSFMRYVPRTAAAAIDAACVCAAALLTSRAAGIGFWTALGAAAVTYQTTATLMAGGSPGARVVDLLKAHVPVTRDKAGILHSRS
jgi:transcriptional regulator with XRE-family HTH domain